MVILVGPQRQRVASSAIRVPALHLDKVPARPLRRHNADRVPALAAVAADVEATNVPAVGVVQPEEVRIGQRPAARRRPRQVQPVAGPGLKLQREPVLVPRLLDLAGRALAHRNRARARGIRWTVITWRHSVVLPDGYSVSPGSIPGSPNGDVVPAVGLRR